MTIRQVAFAVVFLIGVGVTVLSMLGGVERRKAHAPAPQDISARFARPMIAGFCLGFGALGYILVRATTLGTVGVVTLATIGGAAVAGGAIGMIAGWALPSARRDVPDPRFEYQGQLARVLSGIGSAKNGIIRFTADDVQREVPARALAGDAIAEGSEVVIERIEDGVAYVEPWERVERRL